MLTLKKLFKRKALKEIKDSQAVTLGEKLTYEELMRKNRELFEKSIAMLEV